MFPEAHRLTVEFCSTHSLEECTKYIWESSGGWTMVVALGMFIVLGIIIYVLDSKKEGGRDEN
jgi:hypothetical protein